MYLKAGVLFCLRVFSPLYKRAQILHGLALSLKDTWTQAVANNVPQSTPNSCTSFVQFQIVLGFVG